MELISVDTYSRIGGSNNTYEEFIEDLEKKYVEGPKFTKVDCNPNMPELTGEYIKLRKYRASFTRQFGILWHRATINSFRLLSDEFMKLVTAFVIGLCMITLFYKVYLSITLDSNRRLHSFSG